ncbi:MAG: hypothetical protein ACOC58_00310 [Chloroflexota bacterium]
MTTQVQTPGYIKGLLTPNGKAKGGRKVWSIDLETVWLPFFTATNTAGETRLGHDSLGAPLRLAYHPDGSVKFNNAGRPVIRVVKELSDNIRLVRENFTAGLVDYARQVLEAMPDEYRAEVQAAQAAGRPIIEQDHRALDKAIVESVEAAMAEAQAKAKPKAKRQRKPKAESTPTPEPVSIPESEPELEPVAA